MELSKKLFKQNLHSKLAIISFFLSLVLLILFSFTMIWMPPYLFYGSVFGFISMLISFLLIYLYYLLFKNNKSIVFFSLSILFIRLFIIVLSLLLVILFINPLFLGNKGVKLIYQPINIFTLIGTYSTFVFSPYVVVLYDFVLKRNIEKNKFKNWRKINEDE